MRGRLVDLAIGLNRKHRITVEVDRDYREDYERLKDAELDIEIKKHREKRSKSANAYFHVLVNKIAAERGGSDEATKASLVVEYGALAKDADGLTVGFKLPASVDVSTIYPYVKCFDTRVENGKMFKCYLVYKQTHLMDSKEMASRRTPRSSWPGTRRTGIRNEKSLLRLLRPAGRVCGQQGRLRQELRHDVPLPELHGLRRCSQGHRQAPGPAGQRGTPLLEKAGPRRFRPPVAAGPFPRPPQRGLWLAGPEDGPARGANPYRDV